jgi:hypothetical protein
VFMVQGLRFRVFSLGFRVRVCALGSGFRVQGLWFRALCLGLKV